MSVEHVPEYTDEYVSICTGLGLDPAHVADAGDSVESMVEGYQSIRDYPSSRTYGATTVHLHQVIETDGDDWVIVGLESDAVELLSPDFEETSWAYAREIGDRYRPKTVTVEGVTVPYFGY